MNNISKVNYKEQTGSVRQPKPSTVENDKKSGTAQLPESNIEPMPAYEIELSTEAERKAIERQNKLQEMEAQCKSLKKELENAKEQGEAAYKSVDERIKCLRIAMNIMFGDNVPVEDHRYLAERDPELYARAVSMRMEKENPVDHKRISEDEEPENKGVSVRTTPTPSISKPEPSVEIESE